ncbi:glycosyltransferase [Marinimicrobium sp. C2-29]|uniref:glycosyltransferase n=1 Tax=Marinimicrobium sp. C2-29 TaxID=3139825 RepID=UPI0031398AA2
MKEQNTRKVGICGWELSHNAAGRAVTLLDLYNRAPDCEARLIGCIFPAWGNQLWSPLRGLDIDADAVLVDDQAGFLGQAEQLVRRNPLDVVHLSKPKLPNIIIGLLYKLIWRAKVLVDIDDEELAFVGADGPVVAPSDLDAVMENLTARPATQLAVGLSRYFDGVTVSGPTLQSVYGGEVVPHARDEGEFSPSLARRRLNRGLFGIPDDQKVVLFCGTPRKHKGIFDTAEALAELGRGDVRFVLVGDFPFADVKEELLHIKGVNFQFVAGQSYRDTADVVSIGDVVVLLQDASSRASQFQVPAKLTDAMAMGLAVLAQDLPAVHDLGAAGAFTPVTKDNLTQTLANTLDTLGDPATSRARSVFLDRLSMKCVAPRLQDYLHSCPNKASPREQYHADLAPFLKNIMSDDGAHRARISDDFLKYLCGALAELR